MEIRKCILTKNNCYKSAKKMKPIGIMVHSTGANNPKLSRYVQPDDGILGTNKYNNHWNQPKPDGRSVCTHAFIGKDKNGKVRTYQTLPFDYVGWHSGSGKNGSANTLGYIGFEICEDNLNDKSYFNECYKQAISLCVELCKNYNIPVSNIIGHYEGSQKGIASNHADPRHWFSKHNKTINDFRREIQELLIKKETPKKETSKIYRVQVGAFANKDNATRFRDKLIKEGYKDTFIQEY